MAKILITGGTGFAASHLVEALLERGETDLHITAFRDAGAFVRELLPATHIHQLNLTDYAATATLIDQLQPEQIYHLASLASVGDSFDKSQFILDMHTRLQLNLLEAIAQHAPQARLLHVSTALVYQASDRPLHEQSALGPDNPYALSKLVQDMMCHTFVRSRQLDIVRVRPFNHIGERQAPGFAVADLAKNIVAIERGELSELKVGNLDAIRDFSDVKDTVQGYILLMQQAASGSIYNLGSGTGYSIQQILQRLRGLAKVEVPISIDPSKLRPVDLPQLICDNEKIVELGYQVTHEIDATLTRILDYWRAQD